MKIHLWIRGVIIFAAIFLSVAHTLAEGEMPVGASSPPSMQTTASLVPGALVPEEDKMPLPLPATTPSLPSIQAFDSLEDFDQNEILSVIASGASSAQNPASFDLTEEEKPLPLPAAAPSLPSIQTFGTPHPPHVMENLTAYMPDVSSWSDKQGAADKKIANPASAPRRMVWVPPEGAALAWPVHGAISSNFGMRGEGDSARMHEGIDIPVPEGTPILAAMAGIVQESREFHGYGLAVILDHGNGIKTLYAHCSELLVKPGDNIGVGQLIALSGNTGRTTAPHLHFGVIVGNSFQNPLKLLKDSSPQFVRKP